MPLLLDAAGLLSADAQRTWRQHASASSGWDHWAQDLRSAPQVSMTALVTRLQAKILQQARADPLTENVCLLWQCARHIGGPDSSASLPEIVRASRTRSGYIPGQAQEVILEAFGGSQLAQAVTLFANTLRQRPPAGNEQAVTGLTPAGGARGADATAPGATANARFVRGQDLVTGHGWN